MWLITFMGDVPSAGVFMFAMGWGAACSMRSTPKTYLRRVPQLFLLGIVINFFEDYVPSILAPEHFGTLEENAPAILATDIYFFAALASFYLALMKLLKDKPALAIISSIALLVVCTTIRVAFGFENYSTGNDWFDMLINMFIRENNWSYFPFTVWIIFPMVGYGAAMAYKEIRDDRQFLKFAAITGIAAILSAELAIYHWDMPDATLLDSFEVDEGLYYSMHPFDATVALGIIALEFVAASFVIKLLKNLPPIIENMSRNVMEIYIAQWVIIGCLSPQIFKINEPWLSVAASFAILVESCIVAAVYKTISARRRAR
ncbi:MAG: acyltransferase family protein [Selenomonadaceae bacterium]|nr:acyltransferase family protein [Selenomonadaceae bacterium]